MPYYTFKNKKTGKTFETFMTISEGDQYEKDHPQWERMCGAPLPGDGWRLGVGAKPPEVFRDRLREIKKRRPGSTIKVI